LSVLAGFAIWKPMQFSWLAWMIGGFHWRGCGILLIMSAQLAFGFGHGWNTFVSMSTGWKKDPEYVAKERPFAVEGDPYVVVRSNGSRIGSAGESSSTTPGTTSDPARSGRRARAFYELVQP
jgi:hypothetical protein